MVAMTDDLFELIVNSIYLSKPVSPLLVGNFDPGTIPIITIYISQLALLQVAFNFSFRKFTFLNTWKFVACLVMQIE